MGTQIGVRLGAIGLAVIILAASVAQGAVAAQIERTKAAERLMNAALDAGQSRKAFAKAIFDYCTETSNNLPHNSQKEDEQLAAVFASNDIDRWQRVAPTKEAISWQFQKMLKECAQISKTILDRTTAPTADAALWVQLENTFDLASAEFLATRLGILRENDKHETLSDLHGILLWPFVRGVIRIAAILPLLQTR